MLKTILIIFVVAVCLMLLEIIRELNGFAVTHYNIATPKLKRTAKEKKVLFLSDLHNREYGSHNDKLVEAVKRERPDLILVTGDMLVGKPGHSFSAASEFMRQLPEICPVYYSNGNHEQRMRIHPEKYGGAYMQYKKELETAGVHFLVNESEVLFWDGGEVVITGLEVPEECYLRGKRSYMTLEETKRRIGKARKDVYEILMVHQPDFMKVYKEWGADLILSGHLHGGIVRIPGIGGVISPQVGMFPKYSGGIYQEGDTSIVVSKGLGTHTVNVRLFNPAELVVLHISGRR